MILMCSVVPGYSKSGPAQPVNAGMTADGRTMTFQAPGFTDFKGGFSATIISGNATQVLSSALGTVTAAPERTTEATPYGTSKVSAVTVHFENEQVDLLFRLGQVPGVPCLLAQAGIRNVGQSPVKLVSVMPMIFQGQVTGKPSEWLVTTLDTTVHSTPPVISLGDVNSPVSVYEYGSLYRGDGTGFLFGPVGAPIAYVEAVIENSEGGRLSFTYSADMSGVQVGSGEARWGQQVALLAEPPRRALPRWAEWVGQTHRARTDKGAMSGWNSWYFHGMNITGPDLLADVDAVLQSGERLRPEVMHLDGSSLSFDATNASNEAFPEAPAFYARRIAATGARPGAILSFRGSGSSFSNASEKIRNFVSSGYTYLKISSSGLVQQQEDPVLKTSFETMREGFSALRTEAGEGTYLLLHGSRWSRATVGMVDANLRGAGSDRQSLVPSINDALRSYYLNGRWFAVDNGCYFIGTDVPNVSEIAGGWPVVRTRMSIVGLICGAAFTGDPWHQESFRTYWRNVEVMTPPAKERIEVLDLCLSNEWPRLVGHVRRDWGKMTVALLWNPGKKERVIKLDFAAAGLDPTSRYAVWSFWDNRYLGVTKGSWTTPALAESASQHLRFTDIDRRPGQPVLIGSSLHIYCGAAEIKNVKTSRSSMEIELTDAGARDGDLFVYSRPPVILKTAVGCNVTGVVQAGENAWRISLADRKRGVQQRLVLSVLLPLTRQIWFWVLIAIVVASLLFGAWRYVAWLNIQREHAMEQERVRIARDLHDDLGANLSEIAMLSDLAQENLPLEAPARGYLNDIFARAESNVRSLGEIVWAIKPVNDTLESFAGYLCKFAQDYLSLAGVRCRFDLPETLPALSMDSSRRHNMFLAAKEAIHNAVKHGSPTEVVVRIAIGGQIVVSIEDNGCGCVETSQSSGAGCGSANMRARMEQIGGKFERSSNVGRGTVVTLTLPLDSHKGRS